MKNIMKWKWFEIREIKDIRKLRILFILFSPVLLYTFTSFYFTLLIFVGGPLSELFKIDTEILFRVQIAIAIALAIPSIVGVWKTVKKRKLENLDANTPFMM